MIDLLDAPSHDLARIEDPAIFQFDADQFRTHFDRRPFKIGHELAGHPLFALERLVELAQALPESRVEYNAGNVAVNQDPKRTPRTGLSIVETIRRIEQQQSWLVLKNVERDSEYAALLDACLDEIKPHSEPLSPGMSRREGFIFITSPNSITPFHIDPENNFLLQIRGPKHVSLFDKFDREVLSEREIEACVLGSPRNLFLKEEHRGRGKQFELLPGDGLHFPVFAPHWVRNGGEVSISFSITFRTEASNRRESLYRLNRKLRGWGFPTTPVGRAPFRDNLKYGVIRTLRGWKQLVRRG
jgi:hypothetical protein